MIENQVSNTALWTAYMRAYHTRHAANKVFDDFLAYDLVPGDVRERIEQQIIPDIFLPATSSVVSRARYTEDTLEKAARQGVKQYVILGAGMDTFAFRRQDLMKQLKVFEIDHPLTQEFKLLRLADLGWERPENLHFIPVDFTKENLEAKLIRSSSYDPEARSFFSWLGVTSYLTQEEVLTTLHSITNIASSGSTLVFDYIDINEFNVNRLSKQIQESTEYLEKIDEPRKTGGFVSSRLAEDLAGSGLNLVENLSPLDIERRYLKGFTDKQHTLGYMNFACAVIK
ncbi:MAG TPA: class I SAM-dependent methyltransferase [Methanosarcina sp.]|nr:class I SAM-dependent methyltransferase [Methanosarcina sp.]